MSALVLRRFFARQRPRPTLGQRPAGSDADPVAAPAPVAAAPKKTRPLDLIVEYKPEVEVPLDLPKNKAQVEPLWLRRARELQQQQGQQQHKPFAARPAVDAVDDDDESDAVSGEFVKKSKERKARWRRDEHGNQLGPMTLSEIVDLIKRENGQNVWAMDLTVRTDLYVHHMIIAEGVSTRHLLGMADNLVTELKGRKIPEMTSDPRVHGRDSKNWMVVDCGDAVAHFMLPETREFYNIESLWTNMDIGEWIEGEEERTKRQQGQQLKVHEQAHQQQVIKPTRVFIGRQPRRDQQQDNRRPLDARYVE